jgi:hypothetical protein
MPITLKQSRARARNYAILQVRGAVGALEKMTLRLADAGYSARQLSWLKQAIDMALIEARAVLFELDKLFVAKAKAKRKTKRNAKAKAKAKQKRSKTHG